VKERATGLFGFLWFKTDEEEMVTMKKMTCGLVVAAVILAVPGVSSAVTLSAGCGYFYNSSAGTPPGFKAMSEELLLLLGTLGVSDLPTDSLTADLETPVLGGPMTGDGVPDMYQLAALAAVLCSNEATTKSLFDNNVNSMTTFLDDITAAINLASTTAPTMDTVGDSLLVWAQAQPAGPVHDNGIAFANALIASAAEINNIVTLYGTLITADPPAVGLKKYKTWFAAMGGLDTGIQNTLTGLVNDLLGDVVAMGAELNTAADAIDGPGGWVSLVTPSNPALGGQLGTLAGNVRTLGGSLGGLTMPTFDLCSRTIGVDDFGASVDYNLDGKTNKFVYDEVKGLQDNLAQYVYWSTTTGIVFPGVPVAGVLGLAVLVGVCALGGSLSMRKK